ncbi:DUF2497 domain-containing protein [Sphingobium sp. H33]|uniref:DUF2497 domain-containing protein n=2 Tax=Sphingobium nicotianae TaxID=2782607 RepID=A0A9X1D9S2_9SPHN|nr:DUF2497 domain-containing protein [Sphingobium nicotianae]
MEEILSSIKRIIAEEDVATTQSPRAPRRAAPASVEDDSDQADDQILELTDALPGESGAQAAAGEDAPPQTDTATEQEEPVMTAPARPESKPAKTDTKATETKAPRPRAAPAAAPAPTPPSVVMSDDSAKAARESLVNLSKLLVSPEDGASNTLEGLVREMLRPMLKDWLDANLPEMVESMVKREIDRITGRV